MSEAHEEIRNLLGRYAEAMDAGDFDEVGELFAHGRLVTENGHVLAEGADAVGAMYRGGTQLHDGSPRTRHLNLNHIFDIDEAAGAAVVRSVYAVLQGVDGEAGLPLQPIISGRYIDRFARTEDGRWGFAERCFLVDLLGDLSHHLTYSLRG